jgi:hypothetical protein
MGPRARETKIAVKDAAVTRAAKRTKTASQPALRRKHQTGADAKPGESAQISPERIDRFITAALDAKGSFFSDMRTWFKTSDRLVSVGLIEERSLNELTDSIFYFMQKVDERRQHQRRG